MGARLLLKICINHWTSIVKAPKQTKKQNKQKTHKETPKNSSQKTVENLSDLVTSSDIFNIYLNIG